MEQIIGLCEVCKIRTCDEGHAIIYIDGMTSNADKAKYELKLINNILFVFELWKHEKRVKCVSSNFTILV